MVQLLPPPCVFVSRLSAWAWLAEAASYVTVVVGIGSGRHVGGVPSCDSNCI